MKQSKNSIIIISKLSPIDSMAYNNRKTRREFMINDAPKGLAVVLAPYLFPGSSEGFVLVQDEYSVATPSTSPVNLSLSGFLKKFVGKETSRPFW